MRQKRLQAEQLNYTMKVFSSAGKMNLIQGGWIKTIRTSLGMTMRQLGNKLAITRQSVMDIEKREEEGTITLNALKQVAKAMDMQLVYGFVPIDGTIEALIERKAKLMATQIVLRTSQSMKLEDQENNRTRIEQSIKDRTTKLINEMPKILWD